MFLHVSRARPTLSGDWHACSAQKVWPCNSSPEFANAAIREESSSWICCHQAVRSFAPKQLEAQKTFNSFGGGKRAGAKLFNISDIMQKQDVRQSMCKSQAHIFDYYLWKVLQRAKGYSTTVLA